MNLSRSSPFLFYACLVLFGASSAMAADASTPPTCAEGAAYPYPRAIQVAAGWKSGPVVVSSSVTRAVLQEFCTEASKLAIEKQLPTERLNAVSETVLSKYLAKLADEGNQRPTLGALLRAEFGAPGLSRPVYKQTVRLEVSYPHDVDVLRVGSETFTKVPLLLLQPGKIHIEGRKNGKPVCTDDLTLVLGQVFHYKCEYSRR